MDIPSRISLSVLTTVSSGTGSTAGQICGRDVAWSWNQSSNGTGSCDTNSDCITYCPPQEDLPHNGAFCVNGNCYCCYAGCDVDPSTGNTSN